jgi:hypothetical protein
MIRVFSLPGGERLFTFTRGIKNTTQYFLNFSRNSQFLLSSSDSGTIHAFQLDDKAGKTTEGGDYGNRKNSIVDESKTVAAKPSGWFNFFMPKGCDDYMHAQKSTLSVNSHLLVQRSNICALNFQNTEVFSFTTDGEFFSFAMELEKKSLKFSYKKHIDEFLT